MTKNNDFLTVTVNYHFHWHAFTLPGPFKSKILKWNKSGYTTNSVFRKKKKLYTVSS